MTGKEKVHSWLISVVSKKILDMTADGTVLKDPELFMALTDLNFTLKGIKPEEFVIDDGKE
jgi:hypothetical protein